jgi:hypothetical protein
VGGDLGDTTTKSFDCVWDCRVEESRMIMIDEGKIRYYDA